MMEECGEYTRCREGAQVGYLGLNGRSLISESLSAFLFLEPISYTNCCLGVLLTYKPS